MLLRLILLDYCMYAYQGGISFNTGGSISTSWCGNWAPKNFRNKRDSPPAYSLLFVFLKPWRFICNLMVCVLSWISFHRTNTIRNLSIYLYLYLSIDLSIYRSAQVCVEYGFLWFPVAWLIGSEIFSFFTIRNRTIYKLRKLKQIKI